MKYTKNNIDGLNFRYKDNNTTVYEISLSEINASVSWENSRKIDYAIDVVLRYLNNGTWLPINKEVCYEIY